MGAVPRYFFKKKQKTNRVGVKLPISEPRELVAPRKNNSIYASPQRSHDRYTHIAPDRMNRSTLGRDGREREVDVKEKENGGPETANAHSKTGGEGLTREGGGHRRRGVGGSSTNDNLNDGTDGSVNGIKHRNPNMGRDVNTKVSIRPEDGGNMKAFLDTD